MEEYQVLALLKILRDYDIYPRILNAETDFKNNVYYFDLSTDVDLDITLDFAEDHVIANVDDALKVYSFKDLRDLGENTDLNDLLIMVLWYLAKEKDCFKVSTFYTGDDNYKHRFVPAPLKIDIVVDLENCEHEHLVTHDCDINTYTLPTNLGTPIYLHTLLNSLSNKKYIYTSEKKESTTDVRQKYLSTKYPLELTNTLLELKSIEPDFDVKLPEIPKSKVPNLYDFDSFGNYVYNLDIINPEGIPANVVFSQTKFIKEEDSYVDVKDYTHIHVKITKAESEKHLHYFSSRGFHDTFSFNTAEGKHLAKEDILYNIMNSI